MGQNCPKCSFKSYLNTYGKVKVYDNHDLTHSTMCMIYQIVLYDLRLLISSL